MSECRGATRLAARRPALLWARCSRRAIPALSGAAELNKTLNRGSEKAIKHHLDFLVVSNAHRLCSTLFNWLSPSQAWTLQRDMKNRLVCFRQGLLHSRPAMAQPGSRNTMPVCVCCSRNTMPVCVCVFCSVSGANKTGHYF